MTIPIEERRGIDVRLHKAIPDSQINSLVNAFTQIDGIVELSVSEHRIHIEYLFPLISLSEIWRDLMQLLDKKLFSYTQIIIYSFRAYLEDNEQSHLTRQYGWEKYIRDVYISYFQPGIREACAREPGHIFSSSRLQQLKERS